MAKLKRDERLCPFCAETIKAAATRCRYCQSDLPPLVDSEPQSQAQPQAASETTTGPPPEPETPVDSTPDAVAASTRSSRRLVPTPADVRSFLVRRLTLVLAALVVLAAVGVGASWWSADRGSPDTAPGGALVGENARTQVVVAAADLATRALSYDYKSLDNDMETAHARMTPSFRKEYDATMSQVRDNTIKNKIVLQANVVSSSIIKATDHRATALVFLNQTTSAGTGKDRKQQVNQNSLVVTLTRDEGEWVMSKLSSLG